MFFQLDDLWLPLCGQRCHGLTRSSVSEDASCQRALHESVREKTRWWGTIQQMTNAGSLIRHTTSKTCFLQSKCSPHTTSKPGYNQRHQKKLPFEFCLFFIWLQANCPLCLFVLTCPAFWRHTTATTTSKSATSLPANYPAQSTNWQGPRQKYMQNHPYPEHVRFESTLTSIRCLGHDSRFQNFP